MLSISPATVALSFPEGLPRQNFSSTLAALRVKAFNEVKSLMKGTVADCLDHPPMSVLLLQNHAERSDLQAFIEAEIIRTNAQMNVAHPMNTPQVIFTAETLIDQFTTETLADVTLVLQRLAMGYYGNTYHKLDCATIVDAMRAHLEEKAYLREREHSERVKQHASCLIDYKAHAERIRAEQANAAKAKEDEFARRKQEAANYYVHVPKSQEWMLTHEAIFQECRARYHGIEDLKGFAIRKAGEHDIFARSQQEADEILVAAQTAVELNRTQQTTQP